MSVLLNLLATTFSISDVIRTSAISSDNNEKTKFPPHQEIKTQCFFTFILHCRKQLGINRT